MPRSVPRHRQQRRSATGAGVTIETVPVFAMTDANTRCAHFVTDEAATAGRPVGRYVAICGRVVIAASLTTPETGYCDSCLYWRAKNHTAPPKPGRNGGGTRWALKARTW
ncbi:MAG: hypothetical protein ACRDRI_09540 [Pseudonocardiaceae bacterium]